MGTTQQLLFTGVLWCYFNAWENKLVAVSKIIEGNSKSSPSIQPAVCVEVPLKISMSRGKSREKYVGAFQHAKCTFTIVFSLSSDVLEDNNRSERSLL